MLGLADPRSIQFGLLCVAILLFVVKIASTIWLVCQPDATTVTNTPGGRAIYLSGKISPALFVAAILARACIQGAGWIEIVFLAIVFVVAVVMAIVTVRQRAAGTWYGYAHEMKQKWRRRRDT